MKKKKKTKRIPIIIPSIGNVLKNFRIQPANKKLSKLVFLFALKLRKKVLSIRFSNEYSRCWSWNKWRFSRQKYINFITTQSPWRFTQCKWKQNKKWNKSHSKANMEKQTGDEIQFDLWRLHLKWTHAKCQ